MASLTVNDIAIGQKIRFKINSPRDTILHSGEVVGVCTYPMAIAAGTDIDAVYRDLVQAGKQPVTKEKDQYVVVEYTASGRTQTTAYGKSWIDGATLEIIKDNVYADIRVYDVTKQQTSEIIDHIKSLGFLADVQKYPE